MLPRLTFLCLLAAVFCQKKIEGGEDSGAPSKTSDSVPDPGGLRSNGAPNPEYCVTKGKQGECVPYYLCNVAPEAPTGTIDIAITESPCMSYTDICCLSPFTIDTSVSLDDKPKRKGCGWRNPESVADTRITTNNDGETKFAEFPWVCAIFRVISANDTEPKDGTVYIGGGSLIHPSIVLTTAHQVASDDQIRVRAGEWDSSSTKEPYPHQDREVKSKVLHEDYGTNKLYYDIAILFLVKPMDEAPNVAPACLPPPRERVPAGTRCFATGWGKDKFGDDGKNSVVLKKVEVPVVERGTCRTQLRKTRLGPLFELHSSFMCAGGEFGKDTCKGDGGSPLSCPIENEKDRYMQSGIVAWGIGCGEDGTPGVYVDVSNLRNWIDDKVAGKGYEPKDYSF